MGRFAAILLTEGFTAPSTTGFWRRRTFNGICLKPSGSLKSVSVTEPLSDCRNVGPILRNIGEALENCGIFFDTGDEVWDLLTESGLDPWKDNKVFLRMHDERGLSFEFSARYNRY